MDRIRAVLGERKISYLGYSYGTYLGSVYAQLFPHRLDRFVLDGPINPD
ncbi:alpha/beta fold hydrolase [Kribbella sp. CA-253562]